MPRLILTTASGAENATVSASAMSVAGVTDAQAARQVDAVIVTADTVTQQLRSELADQPGVTGVFDDIQAIPQVARNEDVEDFLNRVRDRRGDDAPQVFELEPTRPGDPITDGGAVTLPLPESGRDPVPAASGPLNSVDDSLSHIGVDALHDAGVTGESIISVIVDTGACDSAIRDDRKMDGLDLTDEADPWTFFSEHGGMSLGIMAGDERTPGIDVGILPDSQVFPIKTSLAASELIQAQDAIAQLADDNPDKTVVVNNSWGFTECDGICAHPVTTTIASVAGKQNVIQVFAAGNSASGVTGCGQACDGSEPGISGPNSLGNVITVGATGRDGQPPLTQDYSSRGGEGSVACGQRKPDVGAPIFGEMPYGCGSRNMGNGGGTSAACPEVAGAVGLLADRDGGGSTAAIRERLTVTAEDIGPDSFDGCNGAGNVRVDLAAEMEATRGGTRGRRLVQVAGVAAALIPVGLAVNSESN